MAEGQVEREVKLEAGVGFAVPDLTGVLSGVSAELLPEARLQATYLDTPDLRLLRNGVTLRHRHDRTGAAGAEKEWTLKLPRPADGRLLVRRELTWPGSWGPVPAETDGLVRALRRSSALGPVARLVTQRRRVALRGPLGEPLAEIDDDVVSVMDGRKLAARFREVEVELTPAAPDGLLDAVLGALVSAGAVVSDGRSKVVRAVGPRATEPPDVVRATLDRDASAGDVVTAAIAEGFLRLTEHDIGMRLDDDPEDVHQARVATRRLRSDLRTFRNLLDPAWVVAMRGELGWLAAALGQVRDADVLTDRLSAQKGRLDPADLGAAGVLLDHLTTERTSAKEQLAKALNSARYVRLLDQLAVAAVAPPFVPAPSGEGAPDSPTAPEAPVADRAPVVPDVAAPSSNGEMPTPAVAAGEGARVLPVSSLAVSSLAGSGLAGSGLAGSGPVGSGVNGPHPGPVVALVDLPAPPHEPLADAPLPPAEALGPPPNGEQSAAAVGIPEQAREKGRRVLPRLVRKPWQHLARAVADLGPEPADEALHEVRIRAKRLRYACEAVPVVAGRPAQDLGRAAAGLQGVLGDFHDAVVAEQWLRQASAGGRAPEALVAGQLVADERRAQAKCRADWAASWKVLNKKSRRGWIG